MSPEDAIGSLDGMLAENGEDMTFIAVADGLEIPCRGFARSWTPAEVIGGAALAQGDTVVIMSATQLTKLAQRAAVGDPLLPKRGDKLVIGGRQRNIERMSPISLAGVLVRLDLVVRG